MIELFLRQSGTEESLAASRLKNLIDEYKNNSNTSSNIYIISNVQCYGQNPQDIDIILFYEDIKGDVETSDGRRIKSFCLTIEVKGHPRERVRFEGESCQVEYNGVWHNVSSQSEQQKYSAKNYIEKNQNKKSPFFNNVIWLTNYPSNDLPRIDQNILGADSTWQDFLDKIELLKPDRRYKEIKACWPSSATIGETQKIFTKKISPSKRDRKAIEAFTKKVISKERQIWAKKLGEQLLIIRGRGGTGKTVRLIQIANQAYEENGLRSLILTYNKALVADISRTLAIQGIKNISGGKGIAVKTIHSFLRTWMVSLGVIDKRADDFLDRYEDHKLTMLELLANEAISTKDICSAKQTHSRELTWDLLLIDESQDWPSSERDLLFALYTHHNLVIADGIDQFVRSNESINWREGIRKGESQLVDLRKCMRSKHQLCKTINTVATLLAIEGWNLKPMPEVDGGKIYILIGDGLDKAFHKRLLQTSQADGNKPIDFLFCVPPSWVEFNGEERASKISTKYSEWGHLTWDGTRKDIRDSFPTSLEEFRVVQYESCRGLEGWVVVCFAFDKFYEHKLEHADKASEVEQNLFFDPDQAIIDYANHWLMIPLTRAIDTLVIHIENKESKVFEVLSKAKKMHPETIEILEL